MSGRAACLLKRGLAVVGMLVCLMTPAFAQPGHDILTKGAFIERYFLSRFTRTASAREYVPEGVQALPPAQRYEAVVKRLNEKGVLILTGSKPNQPLTRVEFITLNYLLAGGAPGASFADQRAFLKQKGVLEPNDIGVVKAMQGDVSVTRSGEQEAQRLTGAEPVLFRDLDETEIGARLELLFEDGSSMSVGEDTAITIDEMVYDPKTKQRTVRLRLTLGTVHIKAAKSKNPKSRFEVVTPTTIVGVRGTEFALTVDPAGMTRVITIEGAVGVRPNTSGRREGGGREGQQQEQSGEGGQKASKGKGTKGGATQEGTSQEGASQGETAQGTGTSPAGPAPVQEVVVKAGQAIEVTAGTVSLPPVQTAAPEQIQQVTQATAVTAPAPIAAVSTAQATQTTEALVQVEVTQAATEVVDTTKQTQEQTQTQSVQEDKGEATQEVTTTGSTGDAKLTTVNTPVSPEDQIAGLTGASLKTTFLGFGDSVQADLFGKLTTDQQNNLVAQLSRTEAEDLLARFQPNSSFTDTVLKSMLDFGAAVEATSYTVQDHNGNSGTASLLGSIIDNVTLQQVVEFINCNASVRSCAGDSSLDWYTLVNGVREFTSHGEAVATGLSRELDRLALAGGTLVEPGGTESLQMLLVTTYKDDVIHASYPAGLPESFAYFVADKALRGMDGIPNPTTTSDQHVRDIWGGELRPAVYSVNGGYQAGQLRSTALGAAGGSSAMIGVSQRVDALNSDGFLAYAVQVEEDITNAAALHMRGLSGGLDAKFFGNQLSNTVSLMDLIDDQLDMSTIRVRDAKLAAEADARAGAVVYTAAGDRIRVQQYVYRPAANVDELRINAVSLHETDRNPSGISYLDVRVEFQSGELGTRSGTQIRDLPWNSYFSVLYTDTPTNCDSYGCSALVGSPINTPQLAHLRMEMGNAYGDYIREELLGFSGRDTGTLLYGVYTYGGHQASSDLNFARQYPSVMRLTTKNASESSERVFNAWDPGAFDITNPSTFTTTGINYHPHAGSTLASMYTTIQPTEYRVVPDSYMLASYGYTIDSNRPLGFHYITVDTGGTQRIFPMAFDVLGDATSQANAGRATSTCGTSGSSACANRRFDTIWDAFRVNTAEISAQNPQNLPGMNIGANVLHVRAATAQPNGGPNVLTQDISNVFIPFPRMIWRGESGF